MENKLVLLAVLALVTVSALVLVKTAGSLFSSDNLKSDITSCKTEYGEHVSYNEDLKSCTCDSGYSLNLMTRRCEQEI